MIKSAASKVMWVGRVTVFLVGLAVILALVFGVVSRATAHTGSAGLFHLNHNNPVTALSTLTGNLAGAVLKVDNNGTGPALLLKVGGGKAPLTVNSTAGKATNLNADKLDGLTALDFARGVRGIAIDADALDGNDSTAFLQSNAEAGGDLSGNYANLQINQETVGSNEVADGSLDIPDVAELHYNFTKDPPSINAGSCATLSETQSVADSGDIMLMNAPDDLPSGLVAFPLNPSTTNPQLSSRLCNITSNSIDAPSVLWRTAIFDDGNDL